jgi:glyoxylase-like metal-dependent hydrolase (beta-lactamase superfamily II)
MLVDRRFLLRSAGPALAAASLLPATAFARDEKTAPPKASKARETKPHGVTAKDVSGLTVFDVGGCNVIALPGPDGVLLVDGGRAADSAQLLKAMSGALKSARVATLINTHWHPEQVGCNEAVGKAGGAIVSHEVTKLYLGRDSHSALYPGVIKALPPEARPTKTTYNTGSMEFAGETVDYRYLPAAHTNGDLFVHFPKHNVIAAGGPVSAVRWPVMDYLNGAFMHGFVRSYDILAEVVKPDTIIIPAEGPTLTGAELVKQRDMYWALFKTMFANFNKGFGPKDVIDAHPLKDYEAQYGDPAQFLDAAYRGLQLATVPH